MSTSPNKSVNEDQIEEPTRKIFTPVEVEVVEDTKSPLVQGSVDYYKDLFIDTENSIELLGSKKGDDNKEGEQKPDGQKEVTRSGRASRSGRVSAASVNSPKIKVDSIDKEMIKEVDPKDYSSRRTIMTVPGDEEVCNLILYPIK